MLTILPDEEQPGPSQVQSLTTNLLAIGCSPGATKPEANGKCSLAPFLTWCAITSRRNARSMSMMESAQCCKKGKHCYVIQMHTQTP